MLFTTISIYIGNRNKHRRWGYDNLRRLSLLCLRQYWHENTRFSASKTNEGIWYAVMPPFIFFTGGIWEYFASIVNNNRMPAHGHGDIRAVTRYIAYQYLILIHAIVHPLNHPLIHPFINSSFQSFMQSCINAYSFTRIHIFIHKCMHSFFHSSTNWSICPFIQ